MLFFLPPLSVCYSVSDSFRCILSPRAPFVMTPPIPSFLRLPPPSYHHTLSVSPSPPPPLLYISLLVSHLSPFAPLHDASFVVDIDVGHVKPASSLRLHPPPPPPPCILHGCTCTDASSAVDQQVALWLLCSWTQTCFCADAWQSRWVESKHKTDYGKFVLTAGKFYGDTEKDKGESSAGELCPPS